MFYLNKINNFVDIFIIKFYMRIAVNVRLLIKNKLDGIGNFTYETLKRITVLHPEHRFIFIFDRKFDEEFIFSDNIIPVVGFPPARHPFLWYLFFEVNIPLIFARYRPDIFLSPDGFLSLTTSVPSLPVVHDLNFIYYPEFLKSLHSKYYRYFFPRYIKKATRIATVSEYSKNDIIKLYNVNSDRIDIVYNGANDKFRPLSEFEQQKIREKYTGGTPYFIFVGTIQPRKNIANLIKAFNEFRISQSSNIKLMLVGSKKYIDKEIEDAYDSSPYKSDIIFTDWLHFDELVKVMASAFALIYPSYFEGFGIPILEAMYCDVPIISSHTTSMPEVAGNAAYYVDPLSVDSIKNAMLRLFNDKSLRLQLIEKGRIQRTKFTWDKTASLLWQSIEKCLADRYFNKR